MTRAEETEVVAVQVDKLEQVLSTLYLAASANPIDDLLEECAKIIQSVVEELEELID